MPTRPPRNRMFFGFERWTDPTISELHARRHFFEAIQRVAPQVIDHLRRTVFPTFHLVIDTERFEELHTPIKRDQIANRRAGNMPFHEVTTWATVSLAHDNWPELSVVRDGLIRWSELFRLVDEWSFEIACDTMETWLNGGDHLSWHFPGCDPMPRGPIFEFAYPPYDPRTPPDWAIWKNRAIAAFRRELDKYQRLCESFVDETTPETPFKDKLDHFEWLVEYQVERESMQEIASRLGLHRQTVQEAIHRTAGLVGLTLADPPTDRGGRPRKPKQDR